MRQLCDMLRFNMAGANERTHVFHFQSSISRITPFQGNVQSTSKMIWVHLYFEYEYTTCLSHINPNNEIRNIIEVFDQQAILF